MFESAFIKTSVKPPHFISMVVKSHSMFKPLREDEFHHTLYGNIHSYPSNKKEPVTWCSYAHFSMGAAF